MQIAIPINAEMKGRGSSMYSTDHVTRRLEVLAAKPDQSDQELIREREYLLALQRGENRPPKPGAMVYDPEQIIR